MECGCEQAEKVDRQIVKMLGNNQICEQLRVLGTVLGQNGGLHYVDKT